MSIDAITSTASVAPIRRPTDAAPAQRTAGGSFDTALAAAERREPGAEAASADGADASDPDETAATAGGPVPDEAEQSSGESPPDGGENPAGQEVAQPASDERQGAGAEAASAVDALTVTQAPLATSVPALNPELSLRLGRGEVVVAADASSATQGTAAVAPVASVAGVPDAARTLASATTMVGAVPANAAVDATPGTTTAALAGPVAGAASSFMGALDATSAPPSQTAGPAPVAGQALATALDSAGLPEASGLSRASAADARVTPDSKLAFPAAAPTGLSTGPTLSEVGREPAAATTATASTAPEQAAPVMPASVEAQRPGATATQVVLPGGAGAAGVDPSAAASRDMSEGEGQRQSDAPEAPRFSRLSDNAELARDAKATTNPGQSAGAQLNAEALADDGAPPLAPASGGDGPSVASLTGVAGAASPNTVTPGQRPEQQTTFPAALRELLAELAEPPGEVRFKVDGHSFTAQVLSDADGRTEVRLLSSDPATRSFLEDRHAEVRRALDDAGFRGTDVAYGQRQERDPRDAEHAPPQAPDEDEAQVALPPRKMRPNDARLRSTLADRPSRLNIVV